VPLSDTAIEVLTSLPTYGKTCFVFINPKFGRHYANIHKPWNDIREKAGLPGVRLHDLRHTFASLLINQGRSLYEVQKILRHSDPKVTARYSHLTTATLQSAVNSASEVIQRAQTPSQHSVI
jgi:integrase